MRGTPTTQSPTIEARRFGRWRYTYAGDVSMDALFEREVQFFVLLSGKPCETVTAALAEEISAFVPPRFVTPD